MPWQSNITCVPGATSSSSRPVERQMAGSAPRGWPQTMPPGIAHEAAEIGHRPGVGAVQVAPGGALLPGIDRAPDRGLVQPRRALQKAHLGLGLDRAREHQRIVAVDHHEILEAEPEAEAHVVERDPAALELEIAQGAAHGAPHVEAVALAGVLEPVDARAPRPG